MVIDAGPAHWPGTASFGGWGNVVLAGHRSTETSPFLRNAELAAGDEIVLSDSTGAYHYAVTAVRVVPNTALWIVDQHQGRTLDDLHVPPDRQLGRTADRASRAPDPAAAAELSGAGGYRPPDRGARDPGRAACQADARP